MLQYYCSRVFYWCLFSDRSRSSRVVSNNYVINVFRKSLRLWNWTFARSSTLRAFVLLDTQVRRSIRYAPMCTFYYLVCTHTRKHHTMSVDGGVLCSSALWYYYYYCGGDRLYFFVIEFNSIELSWRAAKLRGPSRLVCLLLVVVVVVVCDGWLLLEHGIRAIFSICQVARRRC